MTAPESPASLLRRAAGLMRERAEAASPGPWLGGMGHFSDEDWPCVVLAHGDPGNPETWLLGAGNGTREREGNAVHAGSWHPGVALAVAEWLDDRARDAQDARPAAEGAWDFAFCDDPPSIQAALKIARAYLGENTISTDKEDRNG